VDFAAIRINREAGGDDPDVARVLLDLQSADDAPRMLADLMPAAAFDEVGLLVDEVARVEELALVIAQAEHVVGAHSFSPLTTSRTLVTSPSGPYNSSTRL